MPPLRLHHGLLQPVSQQHAIGQVRQQVIVCDVLQLLLVGLHGRDVGEQRHIVLYHPLCVSHGADGLHHGKQLTRLVAVPDFTGPVAFFRQFRPHGGIKIGRLLARLQHAGRLANGVVMGIARELGEGVIHLDDHPLRVGDHDAFAGMAEHAGGQLKFLLGQLAGGDVAGRADHAQRPARGGAAHHHAARQQPFVTAVFAAHLLLDTVDVAALVHQGLKGLQRGCPRSGCEPLRPARQRRGLAAVQRWQPHHLTDAGRHHVDAGVKVVLPHAVASAFQRKPPAFLADLQGLSCALKVLQGAEHLGHFLAA